jgi:hypothetical protein
VKPLFDLDQLKAEIEAGRIGLHICEERVARLIELLGDDYKVVIKAICARLQPTDFCGHWGLPNQPGCADVYGIMSDTIGQRSDEEYAWYVKIGVIPGTNLDERRWFLSFHPTTEIHLHDGTCLRTTVDDFEECDDE